MRIRGELLNSFLNVKSLRSFGTKLKSTECVLRHHTKLEQTGVPELFHKLTLLWQFIKVTDVAGKPLKWSCKFFHVFLITCYLSRIAMFSSRPPE
jgi:hypothetical protein